MSDPTIRVCAWCGEPSPSWCESCEREMRNRVDPNSMTKAERITELEWFFNGPGQTCEVPFGVMHGRMEALMGRGVFSHEFANPERLLQEARNA